MILHLKKNKNVNTDLYWMLFDILMFAAVVVSQSVNQQINHYPVYNNVMNSLSSSRKELYLCNIIGSNYAALGNSFFVFRPLGLIFP